MQNALDIINSVMQKAGKLGQAALTRHERIIFTIANMDAGIRKEGFGDYLHNTGTDEWRDCVEDLQAIRALATAEVMLRALAIVGDSSFESLDDDQNSDLAEQSSAYEEAVDADDLGAKYEAHLTQRPAESSSDDDASERR